MRNADALTGTPDGRDDRERLTVEGVRLPDADVRSVEFAVEHLRDKALPMLDGNRRAQALVAQARGMLQYVLDHYAAPSSVERACVGRETR